MKTKAKYKWYIIYSRELSKMLMSLRTEGISEKQIYLMTSINFILYRTKSCN